MNSDTTPADGDLIVVWFSCGAASAVAAAETIAKYGDRCTVRIVNQPVIEEGEDNRRFCNDVSRWLGQEVELFSNPKYPTNSAVDVWDKRGFMSAPYGAPCTVHLKKEARQLWEVENKPDWHVLGFTADEVKRHERFVLSERSNVIPVLIDAGLHKVDCFQALINVGLRLPDAYRLGYPNANCVGCVKATSPTYWNHVRKANPAVFADRAEQSRRLGARLVRHKGERIFLDELPANARGASMKTMQTECGIFCEERS